MRKPVKRQFDPEARGPLDGVRVVDLSRLVAGNILTLQLADFGAEVIKVEPPEGDTLRSWRVKGIETAWKVYSRNKKSVALDLRSDAGRAIVRELAKSGRRSWSRASGPACSRTCSSRRPSCTRSTRS
jgi:formyl-CoA transferase